MIPPLSPFPGRGAAPDDYIAQADTTMQQLPGVIAAMNALASNLNLGAGVLSLGYLPAVAYGAGIAMKLATQTVEYGGVTYAPLLESLPFVTSGAFEAAKFRVIQGAIAGELAAPGGSFGIGFIAAIANAVARTLQDKNREFPSITDLGAVSGADNTAVFAALEADAAHSSYWVPPGTFACGATTLKKHYFGPGSIGFSNGLGLAGQSAAERLHRTTASCSINAGAAIGRRSMTLIGNSIAFGAGVTAAQSWWGRLQAMVNRVCSFGQGSCQSGGNLDRLTTAGPVTEGITGPVHSSRIVGVGGSLSFQADYIDVVGFYFERSPGAGSIEVRANGVLVRTVSCAGVAASNVFSEVGPILKGRPGDVFSLTCVGAPVEINGIFASHLLNEVDANPVFLQLQAKTGYGAADFTSAAAIAAIRAQTVYTGFRPLYIIDLATNPIYSPDKKTTATQYFTDVESIMVQLGVNDNDFCLVVPDRAGNSTYTPILNPFDDYRDAIYRLARKYGADVLDFSEVDLLAADGYQADGLHASERGHARKAAFAWPKLFSNMSVADRVAPITLGPGIALAGAPYAPAQVSMGVGGKVFGTGALSLASVGTLVIGTLLATLRADFAAPYDIPFAVTGLGDQPTVVNVLVSSNGKITYLNHTGGGTLSYIFLNQISYCCI